MGRWEALPGGEEPLAHMRGLTEDVFMEDVEGDFSGVQNYTSLLVGPNGPGGPGPDVERTQMGYSYRPEALEHAIRRAVGVTGLPVIVTENGIATADDTRRAAFIEQALRGVEACLRDGLDVHGYLYWSLFYRRPQRAGALGQAERARLREDRTQRRHPREGRLIRVRPAAQPFRVISAISSPSTRGASSVSI